MIHNFDAENEFSIADDFANELEEQREFHVSAILPPLGCLHSLNFMKKNAIERVSFQQTTFHRVLLHRVD